jgi:hypothetical protein
MKKVKYSQSQFFNGKLAVGSKSAWKWEEVLLLSGRFERRSRGRVCHRRIASGLEVLMLVSKEVAEQRKKDVINCEERDIHGDDGQYTTN